MKRKGLILLSGGLDSTLAANVLMEQGVELEAINLVTCFCTCTKKGCRNEALKVSEKLGIKLKIINMTKEYLEIVKNPKHGYGRNINPCIDCRIFIFKKAKDYMKEIDASFIATGEVLGERPMSQRMDAIRLIEKEAGLKGLIVRPLSAKLLPPSEAETNGIVDRDKLLDIRGRSRKPQIELAKHFNIKDYPCPAGGCLLTDSGFAKRSKDLMERNEFTIENIHLLKVGRHFRLNSDAKLMVGRNESENERLLSLAREGDLILDAKDAPGPIGILRGKMGDNGVLKKSAGIVVRYSDNGGEEMQISYWKHPDGEKQEVTVPSATEVFLDETRI